MNLPALSQGGLFYCFFNILPIDFLAIMRYYDKVLMRKSRKEVKTMTLQIKDEQGKVIMEKEVAIYNNMFELKVEDLKQLTEKETAPAVIGAFH